MVFALVNVPAFLTPDIFLHGLNTEIVHALSKHIIVWHGWYSYFLFHWTTSLWPGLGLALAIAGLAGALMVMVDWPSSPPAIRLVLVFAMLWYLVHELSPMKPFMGIERHMTVMGGLFAVLAVDLIDRLCGRAPRPWQVALAACIIGIIAASTAASTIAIAHSAPNDTRSVVERVRAALDGRDAVDWYATFPAYGHYPPLTAIEDFDRIPRGGAGDRRALRRIRRLSAPARGGSALCYRVCRVARAAGHPGGIDGGQLFLPQRDAADRCVAQQ